MQGPRKQRLRRGMEGRREEGVGRQTHKMGTKAGKKTDSKSNVISNVKPYYDMESAVNLFKTHIVS